MNPKLLGSLLVGIIVLTGVYIGTLSLDQQQVADTVLDSQQAQVSSALPSGLLAHLTFDDSSLNDASGNGNNGSWSGSSSFSSGKIGNGSASFGGSNYVVIDKQVYSLSGGTVAFWFKKSGNGVLTGSYGGSGNQRAPLFSISSSGKLQWEFAGSIQNEIPGTIDSGWHHVALTYNSGFSTKVYLDGKQVDSESAGNPGDFLDQVHIGHLGNYGSLFGNASVDDFRIYSKALSSSEVSTLYKYAGETTSSDTTGPVISNIDVSDITESQVKITWTTNEDSDSQVEFGLTSGYGSYTVLNTSKVTSHSEAIANLAANTEYSFRVISADASGNKTSSSNSKFTTMSVKDTTPPVSPTHLSVSNITQTSLKISWSISSDNVGTVGYKVYRNGIETNTTSSTNFTDSGLTPNTDYSYAVVAIDAAGNISNQSTALPVKTLPKPPTATISTDRTSVTSGQPVVLTWSSTDATSCTGTGGTFAGTKGVSGNQTVYPTVSTASTISYGISCSALGVTSPSSSVNVSVAAIPDVNSTMFRVGDRVQTLNTTNVRATGALSGTLLGTQAKGALATIVSGGKQNPTDKYFWWYFNYDTGVDGYSGEDNFKIYTSAPVQTFTVTTSKTGAGSGTVSCNPTSCSANVGSSVTVSAQSSIGSTLSGLSVSPSTSGTCTAVTPLSTSGSCTLNSAGTVTAQFNLITQVSDTIKPVVSTFTVPSTSSSLTVTTSIAATDNVAVTGYRITESSTAPLATATGWSVTAPTSYTFASAGSKTLYAWAKDLAGNVSLSRSASVTISTTPGKFTIPQQVISSGVVNVRSSAAGTLLGTQNSAIGTTVSGPVNAALNGTTYGWWNINFTSGVDGWVADDVLETYTPPVPDTEAPTVPAGVTATAQSSTQINLTWNASTDNKAVTGYKVFRDGVLQTNPTPTARTFQSTGLTPNTSYTFAVSAYDAATNESDPSAGVSRSTLDVGIPTATISASQSSVVSGDSVTITWSSTDATACTVTKAGSAWQTGTSGTSVSSGGLTAATTFSISCTGVKGPSPTASVTVGIREPGQGYYIMSVGAGLKNGSSVANATSTLPKKWVAGTTYYFGPGTYPALKISDSGTVNEPIVLRRLAEKNEKEQVLDAEAVKFGTASLIYGNNIELDGMGWHGFVFNTSGVSITDNIPSGASVIVTGSNVKLKNVFFKGSYSASTGHMLGIKISTGTTTVSYSDFYQSVYEDQFVIVGAGAGDVVFDHNVFRDNNKPNRNDTSHRDVANPWTGSGGWGLTVTNNIFYNTPGHASDQPQGDELLLQVGYSGSATPLKKVVAYNNVDYGTSRFIAFGSSNSGVNSFQVYNNTIRSVMNGNGLGITVTSPAPSPATGNNIENGTSNTAFTNGSPTCIPVPSTCSSTNSVFGADGKPFTSDDAFALTANSTGADGKGSTSGLRSLVDITGKIRSSTAPDLGAYER